MPERLEGRNGLIWRDYCSGWSQEMLAERHGLTQGRVSQIISAVRASLPADDLAEHKAQHLESIAEMRRIVTDLMRSDPPPAYSNGRPILDEDGRMVRDHAGHMQAIDRAVKLLERTAKLLGLDATVKVDVNVSEAAREAQQAAAAEAMARLAERSDPDQG